MKHAPLLLALVTGIATAGPAASAPTPPESLVVCSRVSDPGERLRCYDTQMAALGVVVANSHPDATRAAAAPRPAATPRAVPVPDAVASAAPAPRPVTPGAKFGAEDLQQSARPQEAESDKVMTSTITSIKEARPKLFIIVLANGQIWMQEGTQITSFFRVGFDARIEKGRFGGYRMSTAQTGEKNMVRVTRLQ